MSETAATKTSEPVTPIVSTELVLDRNVLYLYVLIVSILGLALMYSLYLGEKYQTFSSAIITALTTIAGFAIGVNTK
ncbi:MAG: hypothetical protein QFX35_00835 [Candidatus Verstraetearchaeota archaeon]|nr:hypothetical protein [Candidatus Verstraetearchaeota archaeon]